MGERIITPSITAWPPMLERFSDMVLGVGHGCGPTGGLVVVLVIVLCPEPFDPSGGVDEFLLTRKEGMAVRADFHMDLWNRRARLDHIAAMTDDLAGLVFRVDAFFHFFSCLRGSIRQPRRSPRQHALNIMILSLGAMPFF